MECFCGGYNEFVFFKGKMSSFTPAKVTVGVNGMALPNTFFVSK